ncbi:MAG: hypothetical protein WEC15_00275, partial [Flavobacteriales bacterium]
MLRYVLLALSLIAALGSVIAQSKQGRLPDKVQAELLTNGFFPGDLQDLLETGRYTSGHNGVEHLFLRQRWQGIEIWNGDFAVHSASDGRILRM